MRSSSITTRIHDPPAPPLWFRVVFYSLSLAWLILQCVTIVYDLETLEPYAYLNLFDAQHERHIDAVFINVVVIGLLTIGLTVVFAYGLVAGSKLTVMACSAFAIVILILNVLSVALLYSSKFMMNYGPSVHGLRQLTIYHKNMTDEHWREELKAYAKSFPLDGDRVTPPPGFLPPESTQAPGSGNQSTAHPGGTRAPTHQGNTTEPSVGRMFFEEKRQANASSNTSNNASNNVATYVDVLEEPPPNRTKLLHKWYSMKEHQLLDTLSFVQKAGFCCGIDSNEDYEKNNAMMPVSCHCDITAPRFIHVDCSVKGHILMNNTHWTVWKRSCRSVVNHFLENLHYLRVCLLATAVPQGVVAMLSVVLGLNMPNSRKDDNGDDY